MSTAPNGFETPKTNWQAADAPLPGDFNRIEGNIQAIEEGQRTIDPGLAPSGNSGTLRQLLDWFANRIKAITGSTNWWDAPAATLASLLATITSHINLTTTAHGGITPASHVGSGGTAHAAATTSTAGFMSAADKTKLNGIEVGATADMTASEILAALKTVDGAGSGLDADTVDGLSPDLFLRAPIIGSWKPTSDINIVAAGVYTKDIALGAAKSLILSVSSWVVAAQKDSDDTSPTNGTVGAVVLSTPSFFAGIGGWPRLASSYSAAKIAINSAYRAYMNSYWAIDMTLKVEMVNNTTLRITFTNTSSNCSAIVYANSPGIVYAAI